MRLLQMLLASVALSSAAFLPGSLPGRSAVSSRTPRVAAVAMNGDYYGRLGVTRNAEDKDIKNAYRKAARQWHPDVNPSEEAKEKFQAINEAYSVLSDKDLRARYDQFGEAGVKGQGAPNMQDFDLEIDFQTALFGGEKKIRITHLETCGTCTGSGVAPGASVNTCSTCGGRGVTVQVVSTILGRMH